jgi:hypothetical protein
MTRLYIAWDIEGAGPALTDPVIAIGCCYGTSEEYRKKRWCIKVAWDSIETKCREEFWSKNQQIFDNLQVDAKEPAQVWSEIAHFLNDLEKEFPQHQFAIISDNPNYDLAKIDYWLHQYCGRLGTRYSQRGQYRLVCDPSEQRRFFPQKQQMKDLVRQRASHTHYPDDDAECMLLMQTILDDPRKLETLKLPTLR